MCLLLYVINRCGKKSKSRNKNGTRVDANHGPEENRANLAIAKIRKCLSFTKDYYERLRFAKHQKA